MSDRSGTDGVIDESIRLKLRWVKVSDPAAVDLRLFPDFLIVGPQRTGTTWLHAHLRFHPQIFLSEPKELFFFSSLKTPESPRFQTAELSWYLAFFRDPAWRAALKTAVCLWRHRELYRPSVRGEATASYAALDRDVIDEIAALRPGIRVILMIRNPIDRAWSHAKKDLVRNRGRRFEDVSAEEFTRFFTSEYQQRCARYAENHDNWVAALGRENVFVGRFDDIARRPQELLRDVMTFLGVRNDRRYIPAGVSEPVNPTASSRIPEQHRRYLEDLLAPAMARAEERFGIRWSDERDGR